MNLIKKGFRWAACFYVDVGGAAFFMAVGKAQQSKNKMTLGQNNILKKKKCYAMCSLFHKFASNKQKTNNHKLRKQK